MPDCLEQLQTFISRSNMQPDRRCLKPETVHTLSLAPNAFPIDALSPTVAYAFSIVVANSCVTLSQ